MLNFFKKRNRNFFKKSKMILNFLKKKIEILKNKGKKLNYLSYKFIVFFGVLCKTLSIVLFSRSFSSKPCFLDGLNVR